MTIPLDRVEESEREPGKWVHVRLRDYPDLTIGEIMEVISLLKAKYPDREIFLDGDEEAICSRPRG
jgi:uncharacterized Ntn-hydrolase superfamily protein